MRLGRKLCDLGGVCTAVFNNTRQKKWGKIQILAAILSISDIRKEKQLERWHVKMSLGTEGMIETELPDRNLCPQSWCQYEHLNEFWHGLLCGN